MAPPKQARLSLHRSSKSTAAGSQSQQQQQPPIYDFMMNTATKSDPISTNQEFSTTEKSSSSHHWTFTSTTRLHSILSSSTANLIGVRPLSPPPHHHKQLTSTSSSFFTLNEQPHPTTTNDYTLQQKQVHFVEPPSRHQNHHHRSSSRNKKRSKNLAEYFPFLEDHHRFNNSNRRRSGGGSSRRGGDGGGGVDHFNTLPDEMVLRILKNLPKLSLGRMGLVNKRFSRLIRDETLWEKIDCIGATLANGQLDVITKRKPDYLRVARGTIHPSALTAPPSSPQPLLYLDLTMTLIDPVTLSLLLSQCPKLTNLSLEHLRVDGQVIAAMKSCQAVITVLNLSMCYDLGAEGFADFLRGCRCLTQLNLACLSQTGEKWTEADLMNVVASLPVGMEQLNLSGFRYIMKDAHTHLLTARLPSLIDLDLSDSQELTGRTLEHLGALKNLQHLGLSRCYSIEPASYALLSTIKSLRYLELFSLFKEASIKSLASSLLQGIEINQFPFSAIARPTVGNRRSSIWGVRVRE